MPCCDECRKLNAENHALALTLQFGFEKSSVKEDEIGGITVKKSYLQSLYYEDFEKTTPSLTEEEFSKIGSELRKDPSMIFNNQFHADRNLKCLMWAVLGYPLEISTHRYGKVEVCEVRIPIKTFDDISQITLPMIIEALRKVWDWMPPISDDEYFLTYDGNGLHSDEDFPIYYFDGDRNQIKVDLRDSVSFHLILRPHADPHETESEAEDTESEEDDDEVLAGVYFNGDFVCDLCRHEVNTLSIPDIIQKAYDAYFVNEGIVNHTSADDFILMFELPWEALRELGDINSEGIMLGDILHFVEGDVASLHLVERDGSEVGSCDDDEL